MLLCVYVLLYVMELVLATWLALIDIAAVCTFIVIIIHISLLGAGY